MGDKRAGTACWRLSRTASTSPTTAITRWTTWTACSARRLALREQSLPFCPADAAGQGVMSRPPVLAPGEHTLASVTVGVQHDDEIVAEAMVRLFLVKRKPAAS